MGSSPIPGTEIKMTDLVSVVLILAMGLEAYRFSTPFGYILLSVESISKGLQVLT